MRVRRLTEKGAQPRARTAQCAQCGRPKPDPRRTAAGEDAYSDLFRRSGMLPVHSAILVALAELLDHLHRDLVCGRVLDGQVRHNGLVGIRRRAEESARNRRVRSRRRGAEELGRALAVVGADVSRHLVGLRLHVTLIHRANFDGALLLSGSVASTVKQYGLLNAPSGLRQYAWLPVPVSSLTEIDSTNVHFLHWRPLLVVSTNPR